MEHAWKRFGTRIDVRALFARDRAALLDLCRGLAPADWQVLTAARPWKVRDVIAHVLGDDVNRLSRTRDGYSGHARREGEQFASFIHRINNEWVQAAAGCSPTVLMSLLETTTPQVLALWNSLDLDALGEPVTWVAPEPAPVWLDCARDFTEYWVHQQQVRQAIGRPKRPDPNNLRAVLDTFLRAMPRTLAGCDTSDGTILAVVVDGPGGGRWTWQQMIDGWTSVEQTTRTSALVQIDSDTLWRLCVRMVQPTEARVRAHVTGDDRLANAALQIVSIIR